MKTFNHLFYIITLVIGVLIIHSNGLNAQNSTVVSVRDHRTKTKTIRSKKVVRDHRAKTKKTNVRDHRTNKKKRIVRDHRVAPKETDTAETENPDELTHYRLTDFGAYVSFDPPVAIPEGFAAKGLGHCVSIPCPDGFGEDTVCRRCTEPPAPKPSAPDSKGTKN